MLRVSVTGASVCGSPLPSQPITHASSNVALGEIRLWRFAFKKIEAEVDTT